MESLFTASSFVPGNHSTQFVLGITLIVIGLLIGILYIGYVVNEKEKQRRLDEEKAKRKREMLPEAEKKAVSTLYRDDDPPATSSTPAPGSNEEE